MRPIPFCENPMARPGIETGSQWWEASVLTVQAPRPLRYTDSAYKIGHPLASDAWWPACERANIVATRRERFSGVGGELWKLKRGVWAGEMARGVGRGDTVTRRALNPVLVELHPQSPGEAIVLGPKSATGATKHKERPAVATPPPDERASARRNAKAEETGHPRENSPISGIVRHEFHMRKSGSDLDGNPTRSKHSRKYIVAMQQRSQPALFRMGMAAYIPRVPQRYHDMSSVAAIALVQLPSQAHCCFNWRLQAGALTEARGRQTRAEDDTRSSPSSAYECIWIALCQDSSITAAARGEGRAGGLGAKRASAVRPLTWRASGAAGATAITCHANEPHFLYAGHVGLPLPISPPPLSPSS
ncbi:hypothetical protein PR048_017149 [Dryococelus australis]|uniref:Uncharacterized protein n=1 Tax=Dryococelus australis TaxID=614101 RepID=A0ABQ9H8T0_9NEOP|nr:hypothetical protein PR048_017149 [Dryococelus australis]